MHEWMESKSKEVKLRKTRWRSMSRVGMSELSSFSTMIFGPLLKFRDIKERQRVCADGGVSECLTFTWEWILWICTYFYLYLERKHIAQDYSFALLGTPRLYRFQGRLAWMTRTTAGSKLNLKKRREKTNYFLFFRHKLTTVSKHKTV